MAQASPPRTRNPRGEGSRLRDDLLDAAAELMARHGSLDKVGVRAVAAEVGVSPTAVYRHFANHTDLLLASVQYCFLEFGRRMAEARASTDDVYDRLVACGHTYVDFALEEPGKYRVMFSNRVELPEPEEPSGMFAFEMLVDTVADILGARGDDRDAEFVAVQVWTWIHGIVDLMGNHPEMQLWPEPELLMDRLLTALGLDRPDAPSP